MPRSNVSNNNINNEFIVLVDKSIIPPEKRLAKRLEEKKSWLSLVWGKIVQPVNAVTTNTKTVGTAGAPTRDYSSLTAWEAGREADLVRLDYIEIAECYNDGVMDDAVIIGYGWITGTDNYIKIYTPTSERHNGTAGSGSQPMADNPNLRKPLL